MSPEPKFHNVRRTYASVPVAAGIRPELSWFMGHNKVTTTLGIYTHLFNADDHARATAPRKSSPSPTVWAAGRQ